MTLNYTDATGDHTIYLSESFTPLSEELLPPETVKAILDDMKPFHLGDLLFLDMAHDLATPCLFYHTRRGEFFAATLGEISTAYSRHLDRAARESRRRQARELYWRHRAERVHT